MLMRFEQEPSQELSLNKFVLCRKKKYDLSHLELVSRVMTKVPLKQIKNMQSWQSWKINKSVLWWLLKYYST